MKKTAMIIQPPYGEIYDVPHATVAALVSALRTNGHRVIPRDLNVEFLHRIMNVGTARGLCQRILQKLSGMDIALEGNAPLQHVLTALLDNLDSKLPTIDLLYGEFISQIERSAVASTTYQQINNVFLTELFALHQLSQPTSEHWTFFDRVENHDDNLYYAIFDDVFKDTAWEEIGLVGITATRLTAVPAFSLANWIRQRNNDLHLVMGGDLFNQSFDCDDAYDIDTCKEILERYVDSIVLYEGESAIVAIMDCLSGRSPWEDVPNHMYLRNGTLVMNLPIKIERLENIPLPNFEGLPVEYYPGLPLEVSRGCYWSRCVFCARCVVQNKRDRFEKRSTLYKSFNSDEIVERARAIVNQYGKRHFEFTCLDLSPVEARRVSEKIIDAGLDIRWCARVRLDPSFSPTLLDVMAEAGANSFHLAPETFSAETANLHNKGYDVDHIKGIFEYWEDNRDRLPPLTARLMVGFPGETFESFLASYEYIERHRFHIQAVSFFSLFKNSTIYERPGDYGITIEKKKQPRVLFANFVATWSEENAIELQKIREFITTRRNDLRKRILFLHPTKRVQTPTEGETSVVDFGSAYKVDQFLGLLQSFYAV